MRREFLCDVVTHSSFAWHDRKPPYKPALDTSWETIISRQESLERE